MRKISQAKLALHRLGDAGDELALGIEVELWRPKLALPQRNLLLLTAIIDNHTSEPSNTALLIIGHTILPLTMP